MSAAAIAAVLLALSLPGPARADGLTATKNWFGNVLFGWTDCVKGAADEVGKYASRAYVGVLVTAPVSCGTNVAVRYTGNAADVVTIPFTGENVVNPPVLDSWRPPVVFGK